MVHNVPDVHFDGVRALNSARLAPVDLLLLRLELGPELGDLLARSLRPPGVLLDVLHLVLLGATRASLGLDLGRGLLGEAENIPGKGVDGNILGFIARDEAEMDRGHRVRDVPGVNLLGLAALAAAAEDLHAAIVLSQNDVRYPVPGEVILGRQAIDPAQGRVHRYVPAPPDGVRVQEELAQAPPLRAVDDLPPPNAEVDSPRRGDDGLHLRDGRGNVVERGLVVDLAVLEHPQRPVLADEDGADLLQTRK